MTSSFDNLPHEVLCCIVHYFGDSKHDLYQIRLINKRCQSVAEVHLFEKLELYIPSTSYSRKDAFFPFVLKPQRCKLVKTLEIETGSITTIDESILVMFPNINRLRIPSFSNGIINWEHFSKTLTTKRCQLREIPSLGTCKADTTKGYNKMIRSHHQTLEKLKFDRATPSKIRQALKYIINAPWILPRVKSITKLELEGGGMLHDLDTIVNKCPVLEHLDVSFEKKRLSLENLVPGEQHQQMMKKIYLSSCACLGFFNICNYFLAKFPNVQNWSFSTVSLNEMEEEDEPVAADELIDILNSKPKVSLEVIVKRSSLPKVWNFLSESGVCHGRAYISYFDLRIEGRLPGGMNTSIAHFQIYGDRNLRIEYSPNGTLGHLDFLEAVGHQLRWLSLHVFDRKRFMELTTDSIEQMLEGGMITHALCNCPALETLEISIPYLEDLHSVDIVHTNLKHLSINVDDDFDEDMLFNLSYSVPNLKSFEISSRFTNYDGHGDEAEQKKIIINMPYNSFEELTVNDSRYNTDSSRSNFVFIHIVLPTRRVAKYLFKRYVIEENTYSIGNKQWRRKEEKGFKEIEYNDDFGSDILLKSLSAYMYIKVVCKSIKSIKFTGRWEAGPKEFVLKKME